MYSLAHVGTLTNNNWNERVIIITSKSVIKLNLLSCFKIMMKKFKRNVL
jgi:hypothetical protein